jgi:hypothetical protein
MISGLMFLVSRTMQFDEIVIPEAGGAKTTMPDDAFQINRSDYGKNDWSELAANERLKRRAIERERDCRRKTGWWVVRSK